MISSMLDTLAALRPSATETSQRSSSAPTLAACVAFDIQQANLSVLKENIAHGLNTLQTMIEGLLQEEDEPSSRQPTLIKRVAALPDLPDVLLGRVTEFLLLEDLGTLLATCKCLHEALNPTEPQAALFWGVYWREWCPPGCPPSHETYLRNRLQYERDELRHWTAIAPLHAALRKAESDGVINLSGNVGRFPNRKLAGAVTRQRPQALVGIIAPDITACMHLRKVLNYTRSVSFMVTGTQEQPPPRPPINAPGFVGYALDLLELRPEEEFLRETVLATLVYRDLTVWETMKDVRRAVNSGAYQHSNHFFTVLQDSRSNDLDDMDQGNRPSCGWATLRGMTPALSLTHPSFEKPDPLLRAVAPWGKFRPKLGEVNAHRYVGSLTQSVASIELALQKMHVS